MKIYIIRHGVVDMKWEKHYDSVAFDKACHTYDTSSIEPSDIRYNDFNDEKIYISGLSRTKETALMLFGNRTFYKSELFNEVPLRSFKDTKRKLPLIVWNVMGRIQWVLGNERQSESRNHTIERSNKAIDMLELENVDCYVVTHACFANTFINQLKRRGFKVSKNTFRMNNLERITAFK